MMISFCSFLLVLVLGVFSTSAIECNSTYRNQLLDADDVVILLIDYQTGLLQTVYDVPIYNLITNVKALAQLSTLANIPLIYTASVPDGPNGPLLAVINEVSNGTYVARSGEISVWDNHDFQDAVNSTGRKTLVIAGIWTSIIAFPAIQAINDGYTVYAVVDASGDPSLISSMAAQERMSQAGVILTSTIALIAEVQRTWNRSDAQNYADLYALVNINYGTVIESFNGAQGSFGGNNAGVGNTGNTGNTGNNAGVGNTGTNAGIGNTGN